MRTENTIDTASSRSRTSGGSGKMRMTMIDITPMASMMSPWRSMFHTPEAVDA